MFKLITLVLGLAIGFGGGVYWGTKNPDAAAKLAKEEERQVVEKALALNQQMKAKLDQISAAKGKTPGSGFLGSGQGGSVDVSDVKAAADKQEAELQSTLSKLK